MEPYRKGGCPFFHTRSGLPRAAQAPPHDAGWLSSQGAPPRPPRRGAPLRPFLGHAWRADRALSRLARPLLVRNADASHSNERWPGAGYRQLAGGAAAVALADEPRWPCCSVGEPEQRVSSAVVAAGQLRALQSRSRQPESRAGSQSARVTFKPQRPRDAKAIRGWCASRAGRGRLICVLASAFRYCGTAFPRHPSARPQRNSAAHRIYKGRLDPAAKGL